MCAQLVRGDLEKDDHAQVSPVVVDLVGQLDLQTVSAVIGVCHHVCDAGGYVQQSDLEKDGPSENVHCISNVVDSGRALQKASL